MKGELPMNGNERLTITMMMLGASGVGKTTMLATMYRELLRMDTEAQAGFTFKAIGDTMYDLNDAYEKLEDLIKTPGNTELSERLLPADQGILERNFSVLFKGQKEFDFRFFDHAGGLIKTKEKDNPADVTRFKSLLQEAIVIINVIDGAALVQGSEFFNNRINNPYLIYELLNEALNDNQEHLVLFVITKCEAFLKDSDGRKLLHDKFEERHKEVLNAIRDSHRKNVVGVLIPVKTLGCVEFSHIENLGEKETEKIVFVRKPRLPFKPEKIEQPLRYALAFALSQHDKNRDLVDRFVRWMLKQDKVFQNSLKQFADNRDKTFKLYGSTSLLP